MAEGVWRIEGEGDRERERERERAGGGSEYSVI